MVSQTPSDEPEEAAPVKTTAVTFTILEAVKELDGARVSELSNHLGMTKSLVHRHLSTLVNEEFLIKEGDKYCIGLQFLNYGEYARESKKAYQLAKEQVKKLANMTNERAQFMVEEHGYSVYVYRQTGDNAVNTGARVGKQGPIHASSAGKAILSQLPEKEVWDIIDRRGLPKVTPNTITDSQTLFEDLERISSQGYAINDEESIKGLRAVGVPVVHQNGVVIGGLSVSGPVGRMTDEKIAYILNELTGMANELELKIVYQ